MDQGGYSSRSVPDAPSPLASSDHTDIRHSSFPYNEAARSRDSFLFQPIPPSAFVGGIENYLDPKYISDPTAFTSRLPFLHFSGNYAMYDWGFEPAFIRKRNERERQRVKCVNEGYARLREHLPQEYAEKRLSKVETLRAAIQYIKDLQSLLGIENQNGFGDKDSGDERSQKTPLTPNSEADAINEENLAKYFDENEGPISGTNSSGGKQTSTCSGENEDSLSSSLSPKIKIEIPSPSDFIRNKSTQTCQNNDFSGDFALKGKFLCQTAQNNLKTCDFKTNWAEYSTSFAPVSNSGCSSANNTTNVKNRHQNSLRINQISCANHASPATNNHLSTNSLNDGYPHCNGGQMNHALQEFWKRKSNGGYSLRSFNSQNYGKDWSYSNKRKDESE